MKKLLFYYFIFSLITGTTVYFLQYFSVPLPRIIRYYLNDFLIIPIVLYSCLVVLKWSRNDKNFTLSLAIILYLCTLYSVLFEFVFPKYLARYTKDFIDIILYFISGITFYILQKIQHEFSKNS
ncbi:hypothetical protein BXQ17_06150 [Polaribacter sp. BM10]|uniref:hypothetical protein n=1 Tax=Polaribacter sp. BM10 TaxID=1529069 RepID=UPI00098BC59A|nr:hypothetical protein [Polaribacter sp. BM10]AQS93661.1 hypothetical protein BXQ17_06150 [Polaribacter sp. BM10]